MFHSLVSTVGSVLLPALQSLIGSDNCQREDVRRNANAVLVCKAALNGK
jgi:hypothetical protein